MDSEKLGNPRKDRLARKESVLAEFHVQANHFVKLIHGELEKTMKLLEQKSYREHRDFPYVEFHRLRARITG